MVRVLSSVVLGVALLSTGPASAARTDLPVTAAVIAVVTGAEIDVIITRSAIEDVAEGTVARVFYHGLVPPGRFDPLYMEAFDLNWNLVNDTEVFLIPTAAPWDDEGRLHAYVYLDPGGYGMINAFLLASGLAMIEPGFADDEPHAALLAGIAAVAERAGVGLWAEP
jgi:endonuclease YncB( thermonuclease family)